MLSLNVLGYPQVYIDGMLVEKFMSNKVLLLLCYLALNPSAHSREKLAGLFWGDMPERKAKSNLRQALHDISKRVGEYLIVTRQTVNFDTSRPYKVDALQLEELSQQADVVGDISFNYEMYSGAFLDGFHIDDIEYLADWIRITRERYRLKYLDILQYLSITLTRQRLLPEAQQALHELLQIEPLHEESHRHLMLNLARQGNYILSLKHYETFKTLLAEELGVLPMPQTEILVQKIHQAQQSTRYNVKRPTTDFFGRKQELDSLQGLLLDPNIRLVTVIGIGGIGKTRLAEQLGIKLGHWFINGIAFIPLETVKTPEQFLNTLSDYFQLTQVDSSLRLEQIINHLKNLELVLILDNFEHLKDCVPIVEQLIIQTAIQCLITSRERLNLRLEHILELDGLQTSQTQLDENDAYQLFISRAKQIHPNFYTDDTESILHICRFVQGMPLAIEMTAGWVDTLSVQELVSLIQTNFDMLYSTHHDIPERHQSIRHVLNQSWSRLTPSLQTTLINLTVFQNGFSYEAAKYTTSITLADLQTLSGRAWFKLKSDQRYTFHPLIYQYLQGKIIELNAQLFAIMKKHATYYCDFIYQQSEQVHSSVFVPEALANIQVEFDNIQLAWKWAIQHHLQDSISLALDGYTALNRLICRFDDTIEDLEKIRDWLEQHDPSSLLLARIYGRLGSIYYFHHEYNTQAKSAFEKSLELASQAQDKNEIGLALNGLGICNLEDDIKLAEQLLCDGISVLGEVGNDVQMAVTQNTLGVVLMSQERYQEALPIFQQSYQVLESNDDSRLVFPLSQFAKLALNDNDFDTAQRLFERCLEVCQSGHNHIRTAQMLEELGDLAMHSVENEKAQHYYQESLIISQEHHLMVDIPRRLSKHAEVAILRGQVNSAILYTQQALDIASPYLELENIDELRSSIMLLTLGHREEISSSSKFSDLLEAIELLKHS